MKNKLNKNVKGGRGDFMSEEEKKAIAYLKFYIERDVMYEDTHYEQIKTILNLIENQQKEISLLKDQLEYVKSEYEETIEQQKKELEELYIQHNQMIIDILKECDYMIKNRYYMNDVAIGQYAQKIKDIAKYYIKETEWIEIKEE